MEVTLSYIDADMALTLINAELTSCGYPPVMLTEQQSRQAFTTLQQYAQTSGRPLDVALRDVARFHMQQLELEALRRQS